MEKIECWETHTSSRDKSLGRAERIELDPAVRAFHTIAGKPVARIGRRADPTLGEESASQPLPLPASPRPATTPPAPQRGGSAPRGRP